jgi:predicted ATPase
MALPLPDGRYPPPSLTPEQQRQYTFDAVLALIGTLAEQQPVLVIVEDLHWVDPSTLELLTRLIDQAPTMRLYRPCSRAAPRLCPPGAFARISRLSPCRA